MLQQPQVGLLGVIPHQSPWPMGKVLSWAFLPCLRVINKSKSKITPDANAPSPPPRTLTPSLSQPPGGRAFPGTFPFISRRCQNYSVPQISQHLHACNHGCRALAAVPARTATPGLTQRMSSSSSMVQEPRDALCHLMEPCQPEQALGLPPWMGINDQQTPKSVRAE